MGPHIDVSAKDNSAKQIFLPNATKVKELREENMKAGTEIDTNALTSYANSVRKDYEAALKTLVHIPSVSMDPAHKSDIEKTAVCAVEMLKQAGAKAQIIKTNGYPVIYGEFLAGPNDPTVIATIIWMYNRLTLRNGNHHPSKCQLTAMAYIKVEARLTIKDQR